MKKPSELRLWGDVFLQNQREERGHMAYRLYQSMLLNRDCDVPWERLTVRERGAWVELVMRIEEDGECVKCGGPLICARCCL
jgi:hypothetical protein